MTGTPPSALSWMLSILSAKSNVRTYAESSTGLSRPYSLRGTSSARERKESRHSLEYSSLEMEEDQRHHEPDKIKLQVHVHVHTCITDSDIKGIVPLLKIVLKTTCTSPLECKVQSEGIC